MTLILEGLDRCGKSTQAEKLLSVMHALPVHTIHYSSPKGFSNKEEARLWLVSQYRSMFEIAEAFQGKADFILDRSHVSEMVYAPMYRGYSGDYVLDIEKEVMTRNPEFWKSVRLVTFIDKPENLVAREDGQSFSSDVKKKREEIDAFIDATLKSQIERKVVMDIDGQSIEDVFRSLVSFIE